jgi:hypothetical protein
MSYTFPPLVPIRLRPMNKVMVVLEDPTPYQRAKVHRVPDGRGGIAKDEHGEERVIHLIEKYDGAERVPDVRRAMIMRIPTRMAELGYVEWKHTYGGEWTRKEEHVTIAGQKKVQTVMHQELVQLNRREQAPRPGDIVWYANRAVAGQAFHQDGVEYRLIGAHQLDFIEVADSDTDGLYIKSVDSIAAVGPKQE